MNANIKATFAKAAILALVAGVTAFCPGYAEGRTMSREQLRRTIQAFVNGTDPVAAANEAPAAPTPPAEASVQPAPKEAPAAEAPLDLNATRLLVQEFAKARNSDTLNDPALADPAATARPESSPYRRTTAAAASSDGTREKVQLWEGGPYWATVNLGAEKPSDYGYYFWWGDTVGYKRVGDKWVASDGSNDNFSFYPVHCPTFGKEMRNLTASQDAACAHWGTEWRMPTREEFKALLERCDWEWTAVDGVNGYRVKGRGGFANASIFLPAAGRSYGSSLYYAGSNGYYLSSVPLSDYSLAWDLSFDSSDHSTKYYDRYYGRSVRPVQGCSK